MISQSIIEQLKQSAVDASKSAYCPYSNFPVGAAVLTGEGLIFNGCNVENSSFGLTICAERNAIFQAVAKGGTRIDAVVVYTPTPEPTLPCGACRQVINEFGPEAQMLSICDGPNVLDSTMADLLPNAFGPANLETC